MQSYVEVREFAEACMSKYGLLELGWVFKFGNTPSCLGRCSNRDKTIEFSKWFMTFSLEEVKETILHEIAHALAGPGNGHNKVWKEKAIEVGARPVAKYKGNEQPVWPWNIKCPHCNYSRPKHRKDDKFKQSCGNCSDKFDEKYLMVWEKNPNFGF